MKVCSDFNSNETVAYLTPKKEELLPYYKLKCEITNCNSVFTNAGNLQLHLKKHHSIKLNQETKKKLKTLYCCPETECSYYKNSNAIKSFASLKYLKQHYQKVHAAKTFKCSGCPKAFAADWMLVSHKPECGKKFICGVCSFTYNSHEALLTHTKRKGHQIKLEDAAATAGKKEIPRLISPAINPTAATVESLPVMYLIQFPEKTNTTTRTTNPTATITHEAQTVPDDIDYLLYENLKYDPIKVKDEPELLLDDINNSIVDAKSLDFGDLNFPTDDVDVEEAFDQLVSNSLCDIETQTEFNETSSILDEMLYSNMYTQTCDEFLSELGLADIQTQTNWSTFSTDNDSEPTPALQDDFLVSTETQTTISQCLFDSCEGTTQHTQTCDALLKGWFNAQGTDLFE